MKRTPEKLVEVFDSVGQPLSRFSLFRCKQCGVMIAEDYKKNQWEPKDDMRRRHYEDFHPGY